MISKDLLEILCCPVTKQSLQEENGTLITADKKIAYPIRQGIPVLLAEEAINL
ncbi:MAG: Trm112 family protein [Fibromonadales bacterium]|nr:Trm112 family protein [Fibromonadales bacterium]